ncbi:hypothetical protein NG799_22930 [Laspinema sp. D1]|uniref:Uncharacterized protein n=1 Tax=Laspinema palackyanum D2a TaxID=2953684 RepID=A0ABT2MWQ8_9CYAN|nr:hypothetical protein [Laspinema sp. D2a]
MAVPFEAIGELTPNRSPDQIANATGPSPKQSGLICEGKNAALFEAISQLASHLCQYLSTQWRNSQVRLSH